jgi:predicted amidohydrolase
VDVRNGVTIAKPIPGWKMRRFAIAGLQLELSKKDNLDQLETEISSVKARFPWIDMVVCGELAAFGAGVDDAQPMPGPAEQRLRKVARDSGIWLVPGSLYESDGARVFNTTPVSDPDGNVVARYRKMFPFLPYEQGVSCGEEFVTFDIPQVGRFGVSICYDMWFPETTRTLAWKGAEVIIHPTMTNTIDRDVEIAIARANAATNQCYFVDINVAGRLGYGRSVICGPGGEVIHQAGTTREIIAVEIDLDQVRSARERGWHGLGQVMKSFRDSKVEFPAHGADKESDALRALGPLRKPVSHREEIQESPGKPASHLRVAKT